MARDQHLVEEELDVARVAWSKGEPGSLARCRALEEELAEAAAPAPVAAKRKRSAKRPSASK